MKWYREDPDGITFSVRVVPRSSRNELVGLYDGALKIRLTASPVEGAANQELLKFLASKLRVPRSAVTVISGAHSKSKLIRIASASAAARVVAQFGKEER